jgi:hypothetical protein
MAITQGMCNSFKEEVLEGVHDLLTDVIKMSLYTSAADLSAATTAYVATNEVVGAGYTAGGNTLSGATVTLDGSVAIVDFNDSTWSNATITARGALLYNSSKSNKAIAVLDFGADKSSSSGDFTVVFPAATASTAVVRLA